MRTAFIIVAIFIAAVLLVRFAAPQAKPRFIIGERLLFNSIINNIHNLGARCAVTEHGLGLKALPSMRRVLDECKKSAAGEYNDRLFAAVASNNLVLSAHFDGNKAARYSWYCGHVGKYPRVYLFCEMLVRFSACEISLDLLKSAINAFEKNAPFTRNEKKILCGMVKYCLIGQLNIALEKALACAAMYERGVKDSASGMIGLDYLQSDDYVCGLLSASNDSDRNAAKRLLENNGVDIRSADKNRRKALSKAIIFADSVLRSLSVVQAFESEFAVSSKHSEIASQYIMAFNIIFPIILAVFAVFTCVFASPQYVALFAVAAIITYGVMRVPVLLYNSESAVNMFAPLEKFFNRILEKNKAVPQQKDRRLLSETAYFGSEPQLLQSKISGGVDVHFDNRGSVTLTSRLDSDTLYICVHSKDQRIELSECDCAVERHRATYHACKSDIELCAEVLVPIDIRAVLVRLTIINRCAYSKSVTVDGTVVRDKSALCETDDIRGGAMVFCDNGFALSLTNGKYGGDVSSFYIDRAFRHGKQNTPALVCSTAVDVDGFSCVRKLLAVVYADGATEAESMLRCVFEKDFVNNALFGSSVYCGLDRGISLPNHQFQPSSDRISNSTAKYPSQDVGTRDFMYALPFGGITGNGDVVIAENAKKPIYNTIANENFSAVFNQFGIQEFALSGNRITLQSEHYTFSAQAFVVINENGVMWSPTEKPLGKGNIVTVLGKGYTEYTCAYNGTVCLVRCFALYKQPLMLFDVTLLNKTNDVREVDIMFSTLLKSGIKTSLVDNGVAAEFGDSKLIFGAIKSPAEYALYKEGYFIYGNIKRTSGFREGGTEPAPTVSVRKTLNANQSERVVFYMANINADLPDIRNVDGLFDSVKNRFGSLGKIVPKTDDVVLNMSYMQALYMTYTAFLSHRTMPPVQECFVLSAAKYVNASAVKNRICQIFCLQGSNGMLYDYTTSLQFLRCVTDYLEYTGDKEILSEVLPYATDAKRSAVKDTALNHILRAVEYLINNSMPQAHSFVQNVWQYNSFIYVLRYWQDKLKDDDAISAHKNRFAQAVEAYSHYVKRLSFNNFFELRSMAEAFMCANVLFDLDYNERAYNILKYNTPIERCNHYKERKEMGALCCFTDAFSAAIYFLTVTEKLFGVKFRAKTAKVCPHTAANIPHLAFDIKGKTKATRITVDDKTFSGSWKMRINKINYPADCVDISENTGDITFYRGG